MLCSMDPVSYRHVQSSRCPPEVQVITGYWPSSRGKPIRFSLQCGSPAWVQETLTVEKWGQEFSIILPQNRTVFWVRYKEKNELVLNWLRTSLGPNRKLWVAYEQWISRSAERLTGVNEATAVQAALSRRLRIKLSSVPRHVCTCRREGNDPCILTSVMLPLSRFLSRNILQYCTVLSWAVFHAIKEHVRVNVSTHSNNLGAVVSFTISVTGYKIL
jgi:hypothetical protein